MLKETSYGATMCWSRVCSEIFLQSTIQDIINVPRWIQRRSGFKRGVISVILLTEVAWRSQQLGPSMESGCQSPTHKDKPRASTLLAGRNLIRYQVLSRSSMGWKVTRPTTQDLWNPAMSSQYPHHKPSNTSSRLLVYPRRSLSC